MNGRGLLALIVAIGVSVAGGMGALAQWPGEDSPANSTTAGTSGTWPGGGSEPTSQPSGAYVPPTAQTFVCTFDHASGMNAMRRLEVGPDGRPVCPSEAGNYGSYFSGSRRDALDALIADAGVRQDRIIAMEMSGFENAAAVLCTDRQGRVKQLVLWDPDFLGELDRQAGTSWASVAVLAHEMGHHLNNDTGQNPGVIPPQERREQELFADRYAGQKLRQFGASKQEAVAVFYHMGEGGDSHPPSHQRVAAAGEGWDRTSAGTPPGGNIPGNNMPGGQVPINLANYCKTSYGTCMRTAMTPPTPVGASCWCPSDYGLIPGIAY